MREEFAGAYRDTEVKVKAAMATLALATGIIYFVLAVTGLSLSAGLSVLIIGVPFFLMFMAVAWAESRCSPMRSPSGYSIRDLRFRCWDWRESCC